MPVRIGFYRLALLIAALIVFLAPAARTLAHDIPVDVTVQAFVKPEGQTLHVLMRLPLKAVMDIEFPRRERDFLDLTKIEPSLRDAARLALTDNMQIYEGDTLLPDPRVVSVRMSLDSDRSFASYDGALAHVMGPTLTNDISIYWEQGILDVLLDYPIGSDQSKFSIHAAFDRFALKTITSLMFLPPGGTERAFALEGDPGLVYLDPNWL